MLWNGLDWVLAAIVLVSVLAAVVKGLVREVIALGSVVAGVAIAALSYRQVAPALEDLTKSPAIAEGASFLLLFLATLAAGAVVSAFSKTLLRKAELTGFDRFLGGIFGLLRGVLIDCALLMALVAFSIKPAQVGDSRLAPYVVTGARMMALAMPGALKARFDTGFEKLRQELIESDQKRQKKNPGTR